MAMRINTNLAALRAYQGLGTTQRQLDSDFEKLSSGLRINHAADDAAGLSIAEGLTSQMNGLGQAITNAQDGIDVAQIADGALGSVQSILQRMRTLTEQAANSGSMDAESMRSIAAEVQNLNSQLDNIAGQTKFGSTALLDGTYNELFQVGADGGEALGLDLSGEIPLGVRQSGLGATLPGQDAYSYGATHTSPQMPTGDTAAFVAALDPAPTDVNTFFVNDTGTTLYVAAAFEYEAHHYSVGDEIPPGKSIPSDVTPPVQVQDAGGTPLVGGSDYGQKSIVRYTQTVDVPAQPAGLRPVSELHILDYLGDPAPTPESYNASTQTIVSGGSAGGTVTSSDDPLTWTNTTTTVPPTAGGSTTFSVVPPFGEDLETIDGALRQVDKQRSTVGAVQNQLAFTMTNLQTQLVNVTASRSSITDADLAEQVSSMTQHQILTSAATSVLAQANTAPNAILKLLQ